MTLSNPPPIKPKLFARIGTRAILDAKIAEARTNIPHVLVDENAEAGTVLVTLAETVLFRALSKGDGLWIIMYNADFYPR